MYNNNPTCKQSTETFKRLLLDSELFESNTGNTPWYITDVEKAGHSSDAVATINTAFTAWIYMLTDGQVDDKDNNDNERVTLNCHLFNTNSCSFIVNDFVEYIEQSTKKSI